MRRKNLQGNRILWLLLIAFVIHGISVVLAKNEIKEPVPAINRIITLNDAITIALSSNPDLLMKRSEVKKAGYEVDEVRSMRLPALSSTYYWTTGNSSNILTTPQGVSPQSYMFVPSKSFRDLNFTVMFPVFTGGILSAKERQSGFLKNSEQAILKETENEVVFKTTELFYRALYTSEYLKVMGNWRLLVEAQLNRTKALLDAGRVPKADLLRDEAEDANVKQNQTEAYNNKEMALLDLKVFIGVAADTNFQLQAGFDEKTEEITLPYALQHSMEKRPDMLAVLMRAASFKEGIRAEKGRYLPQLSLMGMYDLFQSAADTPDNGYTVGLVTSLPLYDGGGRRAEVKKAESEYEKVLAEMKGVHLRIENEVRQAFLQLNAASQNLATAKAALLSAGEYLRITELRHETGRAIKIEVYDALLNNIRAETNNLRALFDLSVAKARLLYSIGELRGQSR